MLRSIRVAAVTGAGAGLLAAATAAHAQAGFEGVVRFKLGDARQGEMVQMYKGARTRMELTGGGQAGAMIMDATAGTMTVLMPQQKMYMTVNMRQMAESLKGLPIGRAQREPAAGAPGKLPPIKATGRTDTVAGYKCEYYVVGEAEEGEMCAAKGLGTFGFGQSPMGGGVASGPLAALAGPEYAKLFKDGFFPLKFVSLDKGRRQVVLEVTQIEKKALAASLFAPPPDYKEMKMPAFGQRP